MAKERPILFSAPMVRALLAGTKTQTRRVITPQPQRYTGATPGTWMYGHRNLEGLFAEHVFGGCMAKLAPCPYGVPGDRLWVRETWRVFGGPEYEYQHDPRSVQFRADEAAFEQKEWKPSIFMPRWASRITLEVTDVRVQRVQEISEDDALAEGMTCDGDHASARDNYETLWNYINEKRGHGWATNPWVWCVSFKRVTP